MNDTAKKLLGYGAAAVIIGTLLSGYGASVFIWLSNLAGSNAEVGLETVSLAITLLRGVLVPVGAALIGAAVVINALAPQSERRSEV